MYHKEDFHIPFVNLSLQHRHIREEIDNVINNIINESDFIGGQRVARFEDVFAKFLGVQEVVAVASGTDALWLTLVALGISDGDIVITVPNTFFATVEAIVRAGAHPVFVDVNLRTATLDPDELNKFLVNECNRNNDGQTIHIGSGRRVAAIIPVHIYGLPADMAPIIELANEYNLSIIEDACQAHGAKYRLNNKWQHVGNFGLAAAFSFYPSKNLGAFGDGGAVSTNNSEIASIIRLLRNHGQHNKYEHINPLGGNSRLDTIQAAILTIKLEKLEEWNFERRKIASLYNQALKKTQLILPFEPEYAKHVYHIYIVRTTKNRDMVREQLAQLGVETGLHYPKPIHLQRAFTNLGLKIGTYPNAELIADSHISLPIYPGMNTDMIEQVSGALHKIVV